MQVLDHDAVLARLDWPALVAAIRDALARGTVVAPPRQVLTIDLGGGESATLLVMPAWEAGRAIGVKAVTFFPGNAAAGKPTINAGYLLFDGADGRLRAALDGDALTVRRTAAASALAADLLARRDARTLLVAGTGQLAAAVAEAHASVRAYARVLVWGRSPAKAAAVVAALAARGLPAEACTDLAAGCRSADVVSTVTASTAPLVRGAWLAPGSHLDLVGAFKADMRESDTAAVTGARLFVDGRAGALLAGDLAAPIAEGALAETDIAGDLADLVRGTRPGRTSASERTVFKSAGLALEDLVAATLASGERQD